MTIYITVFKLLYADLECLERRLINKMTMIIKDNNVLILVVNHQAVTCIYFLVFETMTVAAPWRHLQTFYLSTIAGSVAARPGRLYSILDKFTLPMLSNNIYIP